MRVERGERGDDKARPPLSRQIMALLVKVDVIIAVHNAESTIEETVRSALYQIIPDHLVRQKFSCKHHSHEHGVDYNMKDIQFDVLICCYNDSSTDQSLKILHKLENELASCTGIQDSSISKNVIPTQLVIGSSRESDASRGAGYARNEAVKLRTRFDQSTTRKQMPFQHFLCILDSDDLMHSTRIAEQTFAMLSLGYSSTGQHLCKNTLMGCQFDRIPKDSTWHYQNWANALADERLYLEKFRECTLIQPTWFLSKDWFDSVGGYLEAPDTCSESRGTKRKLGSESGSTTTKHYQLIHPSELSAPKDSKEKSSLRLAEDSRFFYTHLFAGGRLYLHRSNRPLVSYRHRHGMSQSSSTPRKLLLKLRAKAWEDSVYYGKCNNDTHDTNATIWEKRGFAIWGAGRDGKEFFKSLSSKVASSVVCFVDVDQKKIEKIKFYDNPELGRKIPILHFSSLRKISAGSDIPQESEAFGRIDKRKENAMSHIQHHQQQQIAAGENSVKGVLEYAKEGMRVHDEEQSKLPVSSEDMALLPVVVCVAMYRSNGALESNVASIGRIEGDNLWHIC